ncbi:MAG: Fic family protein, partial [Bacteroidota bacterium]
MSIERQLSTIDSIQKIDQLQAAIDSYRPIPEDIQGRIFQKFRLEWNYHSNAIEGNPYTFGETVTFILHGITAKGKKLKDHLDIKGHNDGINFLLGLVKDQRDINETDIRNLHKIILV